MIQRFRHRGLRQLYESGNRRNLKADQVPKIERILARLDEATDVSHMDLPGFRFHPLRGTLAGFWAVTVQANWRIVFRFEAGHAYDVDLVDYH